MHRSVTQRGTPAIAGNQVADAINLIGVRLVARELGCTRERVRRWKRLGTMVDAKRAEIAFVARRARVSIQTLTRKALPDKPSRRRSSASAQKPRKHKASIPPASAGRPRARVNSARREQKKGKLRSLTQQ